MFDQTRFFLNWLLPIFTVASLYGSIWFLINSKIQLDDLTQKKGQIVEARFTNNDSETYIEIFVTNGDLVFLNSNWKSKFNILKKESLIGKNINYYCKSNKRKKIFPYQLRIDNDIIIDISEKRDVWLGMSYFFGFIFFLCSIGLLMRICYLKRDDENPTCGLIKSLK